MIDRSAAAELLASDVVAFRVERDVIVAAGADVAEYLHGQVSQAVSPMAVGASAWTLLLEPQGRISAWMRMTRIDDETFWLDMDAGSGEGALARLERFKLRMAASFELSTQRMIAVRGPNADPAIASAGVVAQLNWPDTAGFDILGPDADVPAGVTEADAEVFDAVRISLQMPAMGREIGEKTIPAELGIVDLSTDFTKGCYVGQELVARVDSRGNNTPRTMRAVTVAADGNDPQLGALPAALFQGDTEVGQLTSAAALGDDVVGLASVKRAADLDQPMSLGTDGPVVTIAAE